MLGLVGAGQGGGRVRRSSSSAQTFQLEPVAETDVSVTHGGHVVTVRALGVRGGGCGGGDGGYLGVILMYVTQ